MAVLLVSQEIASLVIQYVFYGGIFIIGLIVLFFMKRRAKQPASSIVIVKTDEAIKRVDKLLSNDKKKEKNNNGYTFPAKIMQLNSEVGDLVVLADREFTENRNIAYEGVLGCYQSAAAKLSDIVMSWDVQAARQTLSAVKSDLERAQEILKKLAKR